MACVFFRASAHGGAVLLLAPSLCDHPAALCPALSIKQPSAGVKSHRPGRVPLGFKGV